MALNDFQRAKLIRFFEPLNFEFVSDFDIRISDFSMPRTSLFPALPG